MNYYVQRQPKVGTLNQLVWVVRVDPSTRVTEVWDAVEGIWVSHDEGAEIPHSFEVPYRAMYDLVRELAKAEGISIDDSPSLNRGVAAGAIGDLEGALEYLDTAMEVVDNARIRLKQG